MTTAWRICRRPFADLSGEGARLYGGRWNSPGQPVVYAAEAAALAVLEVRVHLDLDGSLLPADYVLMSIDLSSLAIKSLEEAPDDPVAYGGAWLESRRSAVLGVPSVLVRESRNLLVNVAHREASRASIASIRSFSFDERLWRAR